MWGRRICQVFSPNRLECKSSHVYVYIRSNPSWYVCAMVARARVRASASARARARARERETERERERRERERESQIERERDTERVTLGFLVEWTTRSEAWKGAPRHPTNREKAPRDHSHPKAAAWTRLELFLQLKQSPPKQGTQQRHSKAVAKLWLLELNFFS